MRKTKLKFRVFDQDDNDITSKYGWYIDPDGNLGFMTDEINCPIADADDLPYIDKSIKCCRLEFYCQ